MPRQRTPGAAIKSNLRTFEKALSGDQQEKAAGILEQVAQDHRKYFLTGTKAEESQRTSKLCVTASSDDSACYYDSGRKEYLALNRGNRWLNLNETQFKRLLRRNGTSNKIPDGAHISPVEEEILRIQDDQDVQFAGPLAGHKQGFTEQNGTRLLVTSSPSLIEPAAGEWPILDQLLRGLLGSEDQRQVLLSWLKVAVQQIRTGLRQPGQALVLAGPVACGKSLFQALVTELLGGRSAKGHMFLTGRTDFNAELFGAEHLILEDEFMSAKTSDRLKLGAAIKGLAVNDVHPCHRKGATIVTLKPLWRVSISVNDDAEAMMVLPPMDDHLADKFILLKCSAHPLPMPTKTGEDRRAFWEKLVSELPAFLAHLESWVIPEGMSDTRYGVTSYHNPELAKDLDELAPEAHLLDLIDTAAQEIFRDGDQWQGTATELKGLLVDCHKTSIEAKRLLEWRNSSGTYLGRLAKKVPGRVENRRHGDSRDWLIHAPMTPMTP